MWYDPEPFGMKPSREAVSRYYSDHGAAVAPEHICLTTSTSEAYSYLFRLLCDPSDEVLIARPSYPLFDFIAKLDGVELREYPLVYADAWHVDLHTLEKMITPRTKAVIVVHPNNPTGNFASPEERAALDEVCERRGLALIVDEVFLDYGCSAAAPSFAAGNSRALTFVLSGISKICALPQMKISWIATCGPADLIEAAQSRMEVVADTFLSVPAPTQHALSAWLGGRKVLQERIRSRIANNLEVAKALLKASQITLLRCEGGWTAVLRVPRHVDGMEFAFAALERDLVIQPGEFYGLSSGHVVVSLLTLPDAWQQGMQLLSKLGA